MDFSRDADYLDVEELAEEEEYEYLQDECRRLLGMDLDEFRQRREDGEFRDLENPNVAQMTLLLHRVSW